MKLICANNKNVLKITKSELLNILEKTAESKNFTVTTTFDGKQNVPMIRLRGKWLEMAGFMPQDIIDVDIANESISIKLKEKINQFHYEEKPVAIKRTQAPLAPGTVQYPTSKGPMPEYTPDPYAAKPQTTSQPATEYKPAVA